MVYVNKNNANSSSKNVFDKHYTYYIQNKKKKGIVVVLFDRLKKNKQTR